MIFFTLLSIELKSQWIHDRVYYFKNIELINTEKRIDSVHVFEKSHRSLSKDTDFSDFVLEHSIFLTIGTYKYYLNKNGWIDSFVKIREYAKANYDSLGNQICGIVQGFGASYDIQLKVKKDSVHNTVFLYSEKDSFYSRITKNSDSTVIETNFDYNYKDPFEDFRIFAYTTEFHNFFDWHFRGYKIYKVIYHKENSYKKILIKDGQIISDLKVQNFLDQKGRIIKTICYSRTNQKIQIVYQKQIWYNKNGEVKKIEIIFPGKSKHVIKKIKEDEYKEIHFNNNRKDFYYKKYHRYLFLIYKIYAH